MPFKSDNSNHKSFSIRKLSYEDILTIVDLRYPVDEEQQVLTLSEIASYIKTKHDMDISVHNLHTFIKKQKLGIRIKSSKDALKTIEQSKLINVGNIDNVISNVGALLMDIVQEKESVVNFDKVVGALTKWKDACNKERELILKERIQSEGQNINLKTSGIPTKETLDILSREIGLM